MNVEKRIINLLLVIFICSCSNQTINKDNTKNLHWDFDHELQYRQTKVGDGNYQLEILKNTQINFARMSVFLVRHSYEVCSNYTFKIEIIKGVEVFTDTMVKSNYILGSLIANVEC